MCIYDWVAGDISGNVFSGTRLMGILLYSVIFRLTPGPHSQLQVQRLIGIHSADWMVKKSKP